MVMVEEFIPYPVFILTELCYHLAGKCRPNKQTDQLLSLLVLSLIL